MADLSFLKYPLEYPLGITGADALSTAQVAAVPSLDNPGKPARPLLLKQLRDMQLPDGGWGEPTIFNAYDRYIGTLAAIWALSEWNEAADQNRIAQAREVLNDSAEQLSQETRDSLKKASVFLKTHS
ncbi:hypothetical protein Lrub_2340 [Legionella rubrilucens]|uniref:Uncharacterized protein n=1 Tax=Legionella rubrilucens TaxID=458 RepID=A0A0W0XLU0_9GAMM|nr:hypothetical protein [Legionella rubrilucens]KTD45543.1 hypothetical protein Lrub_2340 [Legionella rubrilucens]